MYLYIGARESQGSMWSIGYRHARIGAMLCLLPIQGRSKRFGYLHTTHYEHSYMYMFLFVLVIIIIIIIIIE